MPAKPMGPLPGDVLRKGRYEFQVRSADASRVHYLLTNTEAKRSTLACDCSLKRWREMMLDAELVTQGVAGADHRR